MGRIQFIIPIMPRPLERARTDRIRTKTGQMITDPQRARRSDPGSPDVCNVFSFHEIYTPEDTVTQINEDCRVAKIGCVDCKKIMAENLCKALSPVRDKRREMESDINMVNDIIDQGNKKARSIAQKTMAEVKEAVRI